jgi:hypothetical protein
MSRKSEFWKQLQAAKILVKQAEEEGDLRRDIFEERDQKQPDAIYEPTKTSNPSDPRTAAMQYWRDEKVLRVEWGDGGRPYLYYNVSQSEWRELSGLRQDGHLSRAGGVTSPGRYINRVLNGHPYTPE